ncbi:hypothetical protein Dvina_02680 [Dactylosporangium vinaceum]|uniref:Uncharacterized protein n=1 Tax=Dactylosporangium vinaceum TaxID=53362 RepID=A0ABV5MEQ5_9ACTN|nr:hypothetical protein [Dactylosporangium vinaceum]UAB97131.1 hypothetical protein Dvina_02680 [Dactylosporangium vinaceum]
MLLLGAGAAHADDTALAPGALDDLFSPTGGPNNQSLQLQAHSDRIDTSTESTAAGNQRTTSTSFTTNRVNRRAVPNMLQGLPVSSLVPTDSLGLPRTTSSRLPNLPALPTDAVASSALPVAGQAPSLANTESSLSTLPLVGGLTDLSQLGLPGAGLPGTDALQTTSIADTSTAFPSVQKPSPRKARKAQTEALPMVGGLPVVGGLPLLRGGGLPVRGNLNPVDNVGLPVGGGLPGAGRGATEAGGLPVVGDALPLGGSDVLKSDSVTGVPVIGGVGPTPGVSTTAVANRLVPTTGALPQAASNLPLVTESAAYAPRHAESAAYAPRHSQTEALPVVTGLPVVGGVAQGVLPFFSGIAG